MKIIHFAAWCFVIALVVTILVNAKTFLVPLFLAIAVWYLINAINEFFMSIRIFGWKMPQWLGLTISTALIIVILVGFGQLIANNFNEMLASAPNYQERIEYQLEEIAHLFGMDELPDYEELSEQLNFAGLTRSLINTVQTTTKNFFLVLIYVIFLMIEQNAMPKKINALRLAPDNKDRIKTILNQINDASRTYILVKTMASLLTGILCYFVLIAVGVDFALFWAFLIFLLNYIPTVGSIVATAFPSALTLIQFEPLTPFFIVLFSLVGIQLLVGSYLEPRFLGHSLNVSPLVVILTLMLWGYIWGPAGMLLCVPITVIIIITLAHFPSTRPIAVLLSKDGKVAT